MNTWRRLELASVEMKLTKAAFVMVVRAFPVRLTPRLYMEFIRAARANIPVAIERQKNYGEMLD